MLSFLKRFREYIVTISFFCPHLEWIKTDEMLGCNLYEYKCLKCGKLIYRDSFNPPVSFFKIEDKE